MFTQFEGGGIEAAQTLSHRTPKPVNQGKVGSQARSVKSCFQMNILLSTDVHGLQLFGSLRS